MLGVHRASSSASAEEHLALANAFPRQRPVDWVQPGSTRRSFPMWPVGARISNCRTTRTRKMTRIGSGPSAWHPPCGLNCGSAKCTRLHSTHGTLLERGPPRTSPPIPHPLAPHVSAERHRGAHAARAPATCFFYRPAHQAVPHGPNTGRQPQHVVARRAKWIPRSGETSAALTQAPAGSPSEMVRKARAMQTFRR